MSNKTYVVIFVGGLIAISLIGAVIHFKGFQKNHSIACNYLQERIAKAEKQLQEDVSSNIPLYTAEEVDEILAMFKDIKAQENCHWQYKKFQEHLKQHPLKGPNT